MQIFDLIYDQNFMENFSLSASTDTIMNDMKNLTQIARLSNFGLFICWKSIFSVPLALIPTKYVLCFSSNMVNASELLKSNE